VNAPPVACRHASGSISEGGGNNALTSDTAKQLNQSVVLYRLISSVFSSLHIQRVWCRARRGVNRLTEAIDAKPLQLLGLRLGDYCVFCSSPLTRGRGAYEPSEGNPGQVGWQVVRPSSSWREVPRRPNRSAPSRQYHRSYPRLRQCLCTRADHRPSA